MARLRRTTDLPRLEVLPLIDVIFLLLTFFIYALVLVVRADLLPVELPEVTAGTPAEDAQPLVVTIDEAGQLFVGREPLADVDAVIARLQELREQDREGPVYLAAASEGATDRLPLFMTLMDRLREAGVGDIAVMGRPPAAAPSPTPPQP
jgi:biopolymer transport protein ExbD